MTKTLVLMPTYNESESLRTTIAALFEHNPDVSLLVIDDNSPDGTGEIADALAKENPRVSVLHRAGKEGLGRAYLAGFEWGLEKGYRLLVEMDADGSHRAQDLPKLLTAAADSDLVIGSRWIRGGAVENWPKSRQLISRLGNLYARIALRCKVRDLTAGFRVYRAEVLKNLPLSQIRAQGYGFQVELAWRTLRAGFNVKEVPIVFVERAEGHSKMNSKIVIEALLLTSWWGLKSLVIGRRG